MNKTYSLPMLMAALLAMLLCSGCGLKYTLKDPTLSTIGYSTQDTRKITIQVIDKRVGDDVYFAYGKIGLGTSLRDLSSILKFDNIREPVSYFAEQLEDELEHRGIPAKVVAGEVENPGATLEVQRYQIVNYRASGFSPWEAGHVFDGLLTHSGKSERITAYMYAGKTPVWSMDEILEPCFNIPASILIQDVASKINMVLFDLKSPDAEIQRLVAEIDAEMDKKPEEGPFWKVLELGYTNNPKAITPLKNYTKVGDPFFKSCAISALGIIGTQKDFDFVRQLYEETLYNEKYMAVKAMGDIGGGEADTMIKKARDSELYEGEGGLKTVVDLYLQ
jgi:hypothetical protein